MGNGQCLQMSTEATIHTLGSLCQVLSRSALGYSGTGVGLQVARQVSVVHSCRMSMDSVLVVVIVVCLVQEICHRH